MTEDSFPWSVLGIAPTGDARAIRSAYAARIKAMDLDADVAGYADLREARDAALRLAKMRPEPERRPEPETEPEPGPTPPGSTPFVLPGEWGPEPALTTPVPAAAAVMAAPLTPGFTQADTDRPAAPLLPELNDALEPPLLTGHDAAPAIGAEALQSPFARLAALLEAGNELDEASARAVLDGVLEAIQWAPIDRQAELEQWLADRLVQAWPRSAPLLEPATAALGWEREWGRIDARPAVDYLGARLRGQRFSAKVQDRDHRYHRAWIELSRPGKTGLSRHLRAAGGDVHGLLAGIRRNFPELEDRFDPQRVASWETVRGWPTGLLIFGGLLLLGFLISLTDPKPEARRSALQATAEEVFGAGNDMKWLSRNQPDLAVTLSKHVVSSADGDVDRQGTVDAGLAIVRERIYLNGRRLTGADFETTMRLRLALLEAARANGPAACRAMMERHAPLPTTPVPPAVRAQERRFAAELAQRTALGPPAKAMASSATVPAELVRQVVRQTGLTGDQVQTAMREDGDANRCATTIALLKATLDWNGAERHAILMTL